MMKPATERLVTPEARVLPEMGPAPEVVGAAERAGGEVREVTEATGTPDVAEVRAALNGSVVSAAPVAQQDEEKAQLVAQVFPSQSDRATFLAAAPTKRVTMLLQLVIKTPWSIVELLKRLHE